MIWNLEKDFLVQKYEVEKLSLYKISKIVGCSPATVKYTMNKFNLPRRTKSEAVKLNKTGETVACLVCGKLVYRKKNQIERFDKFFCSWDCAKEFQATGSSNWRSTREYKDWRNRVVIRDARCLLCESTVNLIAHHIIEAQIDPTLKYELENGCTLCYECHIMVHKQGSQNFIKPLQEVILVEELRISEKV